LGTGCDLEYRGQIEIQAKQEGKAKAFINLS
jgi:hypothetical protein